MARGTLVIFEGKWEKDRVVPLGDRAYAWVKKYLNDIRPQLVDGDDCSHLFLTDYGEPFVKNRMTGLVQRRSTLR